MKKNGKKILIGLLIASICGLSISTPVLANKKTALTKIPVSSKISSSVRYNTNKPIPGIFVEDKSSLKAVVPAQYIVTSKVKKGTVRHITKYITDVWAKADKYTLAKGESTSYGIKIGGTKDFIKGIKASGDFTITKSFSSTVTTSIQADAKRFSKLTYQVDYNRYSVTLYKIPKHNDMLPVDRVLVGTNIVDEPTKTIYAVVVYK